MPSTLGGHADSAFCAFVGVHGRGYRCNNGRLVLKAMDDAECEQRYLRN